MSRPRPAQVAIVDSGGANIHSVAVALRRLGVEAEFTANAARIETASHVILPGVGSAAAAMRTLQRHGLEQLLPALKQPVLGICLGAQLLFEASEEGHTACLGIIPGQVRRLPAANGLRLPHMGWNRVQAQREDPLTANLAPAGQPLWAYFVHSFAAEPGPWTLATALHGAPFSAIVRQGNFMAAQFHPERSGPAGQRLLQNFLALAA